MSSNVLDMTKQLEPISNTPAFGVPHQSGHPGIAASPKNSEGWPGGDAQFGYGINQGAEVLLSRQSAYAENDRSLILGFLPKRARNPAKLDPIRNRRDPLGGDPETFDKLVSQFLRDRDHVVHRLVLEPLVWPDGGTKKRVGLS